MPDEKAGAERHIRDADFNALVDFLASQAYIGLGAVNHPQTEKPVLDLVYAKHAIDLLTIVEKKSDGNLTAPEKSYMENVLYQLRMTYMRMQQVATTPPDELPEEADTDADDADATDSELPEERDAEATDGELAEEGEETDVQ
ncbi:MAG: DUF1844 domain-containing protein [Candidatus Poribacteria bacterium]